MTPLLWFAWAFAVVAVIGLITAIFNERYFVEGMVFFVVGLICVACFIAMHMAYFA